MGDESARPWERQPYDTDASFEAFSLFYFPQSPPRSVDKAYRTARPRPARFANKPDTRRAASSWRNWSQGRKSDRTRIPGALSWHDRAAAWDDYVLAEFKRKEIKRREKIVDSFRDLVEEAFREIFAEWSAYQRTGDESLTELTLATRRLWDVAAAAFQVSEPATAVEVGAPGEFEAERAGERLSSMSHAERLELVAKQLLAAKKRRDPDEDGDE